MKLVVSPEYAEEMKSGAVWLKVLALCSTVALGGGYVWWSQKRAEDQRAKAAEARERMTLSGSKSKVILGDGDGPVRVDLPGDGWKGVGQTNADSIQLAPAEEPDRTLLPGSKSFVLPPETEEKEAPAKPRTVLPGSKTSGLGAIDRDSIDRILNQQETEKVQEKEEP